MATYKTNGATPQVGNSKSHPSKEGSLKKSLLKLNPNDILPVKKKIEQKLMSETIKFD